MSARIGIAGIAGRMGRLLAEEVTAAGATLAGALKVAEKAKPGSTILAMLPDTGERYLSTPLFGDVGADMNDDEVKISQSTPGQQMPAKTA